MKKVEVSSWLCIVGTEATPLQARYLGMTTMGTWTPSPMYISNIIYGRAPWGTATFRNQLLGLESMGDRFAQLRPGDSTIAVQMAGDAARAQG